MTTIVGLLTKVFNDEVVLPAIQRDFVWTEAQTETLLDSIMRGYPIGIALLWETYNDIDHRLFVKDFRGGTIHSYRGNARHRRLRVVLDGQQRIQSLYIALFGQRDGRSTYFDVLSGQQSGDTEEERFLFESLTPAEARKRNKETVASIREAEKAAAAEEKAAQEVEEQEEDEEEYEEYETPYWWMSVADLLSMSARARLDLVRELTAKLKLSPEDTLLLEENLTTFDQMFTKDQSILKLATIDEDLPKKSPGRKSEMDVLEIFVRINRQGTALIRSDLIFSMLKLNWRESARGLPEFVQKINRGNSFDLDTDFVVRCLFAVSDLGGKLDPDLLRQETNITALQNNYEQCCDAIRATVDFVQNECAVQSSRLLGSSTTLVPIVDYVFTLPRHQVPDDQVDRLRTAVYLFGLARPFSRYGESRVGNFVREALDTREENDHSFPLEMAISRVRDWGRINSLETLAEENPSLALHLIQGKSGARAQYSRDAPELDHIFPRSELRRRNKYEEDINDLGNLWILAQGKNGNKSNKPPKEYFDGVSKTQLDKALIDPTLLNYGSFSRFIRERRAAILKRLSKKIRLTDAHFQRR